MNRRRLKHCLVPLVVTFLAAAPAYGRDPEAAFHVKDNWLEFEIRQDGLPCGKVEVQVIDDHGKSFASGEAGDDGQGAFPLPPGKSLILEFKTAGKKADHVFLRRTAEGVEPSRVLLSYGLLPCCRTATAEKKLAPAPEKKGAGNPSFQPTRWLLFTAGLVGVVFALTQLVRRRPWGAAHRLELGGFAVILVAASTLVWFFLPFGQATNPPERDLARAAEKDLERRHYHVLERGGGFLRSFLDAGGCGLAGGGLAPGSGARRASGSGCHAADVLTLVGSFPGSSRYPG